MADKQFAGGTALVHDPAPAHLATTRQALVALGFDQVEAVTDRAGLAERIAEARYDLVVAETGDPIGPVAGLVRAWRAGEAGLDPFAAIILTTWSRREGDVRALIDSGADDVLLRPFSLKALKDRVDALARGRKPFVVTSDYVGPDRRSDPGRAGSAPLFTPPNTLKALAEGDQAAVRKAAAAGAALKVEVDRERLRRLAIRVATAARLRLDAPESLDAQAVAEIDRAARELRRKAVDVGLAATIELADALCEITSDMTLAQTASARGLRLCEELSVGAYAAASGQPDKEEATTEVMRIVAIFRARRATTPLKIA